MKLELIEYVKVNLPAGFLPYSIYSIIIKEQEMKKLQKAFETSVNICFVSDKK